MNTQSLHSLQIISLVGIVTSIVVQLVYVIIEKDLPYLWALYPCWVIVFMIGYFLNKKSGK